MLDSGVFDDPPFLQRVECRWDSLIQNRPAAMAPETARVLVLKMNAGALRGSESEELGLTVMKLTETLEVSVTVQPSMSTMGNGLRGASLLFCVSSLDSSQRLTCHPSLISHQIAARLQAPALYQLVAS